MMKHFLSVRDMDREAILETLRVASDMKGDPAKYAASLAGKTLAMVFEKPSLRTRASFDVGIQQLGGYALSLQPTEIQLGKRESVADVTQVLARMVQGIMVRTFAHAIIEEMAAHSSVPIINGLTDYTHPCQALADYLTVQEVKGPLAGLKLCYVGDGNNVAHSLMFAGARLGVHVTVACPEGHDPDGSALRLASEDAEATGARIAVTHDPAEGVEGADVVYTDVWASMGQEAEAEVRKKQFRPFQVDAALMSRAASDAIFLHCLPAHRGEEVSAEVLESPASVVFQQAENRLHAQKALMHRLMK